MPRDWTQIGIRLVAATLAYNLLRGK